MKGIRLLFVLVLAMSGLAMADDAKPAKARVDIVATASKINLKAGTLGDGVTALAGPGATGDAAKQNIAFQMPVDNATWKTMTFKFTPETDGKVQISLRGEYRKETQVWVYYDAVEVAGATIANGDFEDAGKKNLPADWTVRPGQHPVVVNDATIVKSGKACVDVSHGNRLAQDLDVKAGTEVTVTLQARLDKVAEK